MPADRKTRVRPALLALLVAGQLPEGENLHRRRNVVMTMHLRQLAFRGVKQGSQVAHGGGEGEASTHGRDSRLAEGATSRFIGGCPGQLEGGAAG